MIGADHVVAFGFGNDRHEARPGFGPEPARAAAIEPVEFRLRHQEDAAQDQLQHPVGMFLSIDKRQRRPPAAAEHAPRIDAKRAADAFDILDQMPGRVVLDRRMRARPPAAALVEQDNPEDAWVEIAPHRRAAAATGAAMQHHDGHAIRVAALFDIDLMSLAHV